MGAVASAVKHVWHGLKHDVKEGVSAIGHSAVWHDIVHGVDDVGDVAKEAAKIATHAVVDVGGAIAHVVKFIPVVGGTLAGGIGAVTDLAKKGDAAVDDVVGAVEHPADALKTVVNTVTHPKKLLKFAKAGLNTVDSVANDGLKIAAAVAALDPEGGTELAEAIAAANKVKKAVKLVQKGVTIVHDVSKGKYKKAFMDTGNLVAQQNKTFGNVWNKGKKAYKTMKKVEHIAKKVAQHAKADGRMVMHDEDDEKEYAALIPYDAEGEHQYEDLVNYIRGKHIGKEVTAHLLDANGDYLLSITFYPLEESLDY